MAQLDPSEVFPGTIAIVVPHMDDCVLACGGTIARLPEKERIHLVYATDGTRSPAPSTPRNSRPLPELNSVRMAEARAAMACLGVPQDNIHFLNLPDGRLGQEGPGLRDALLALIGRIEPDQILMPFRYDRHPDHLALNRALVAAHREGEYAAELIEYFVYYRWRLLPEGDVRRCIAPRHLFEVGIAEVADQKRAALNCFESQTTIYYPWQSRPILPPGRVDEVSRSPELFLKYDASIPESAIFTRSVFWIRFAHAIEPLMKRRKDMALDLWRGSLRWRARNAA